MNPDKKANSPEENQDEQTFDAFICYSRQDIDFARKFESALESYIPPKELGVPQRRLNIFRDEQDLVGPKYYDAIENHLERSKKLIVLCSPACRQSDYTNDEIRRFSSIKSADNIIPILVSGIPNNEARVDQEAEKAFPEALCEAIDLPLATSYLDFNPSKDNIKKGGFENAWYTTLANLYGVSRQEIEQRDYKRRLHRRNIALAIVSVIVAALTSLSIVAWLQKITADEQRNIAEIRLAENYWQQAKRAREENDYIATAHLLAQTAVLNVSKNKHKSIMLGVSDLTKSVYLEAITDGFSDAELPEHVSLPRPPVAKFSPDEKSILSLLPGDATLKGNGIATVWNVADSTPLSPPLQHKYWIYGARFNNNGSELLTWGGTTPFDAAGEVLLWNVKTGSLIGHPMKHREVVTGAVFNSDESQILSWGDDGSVKLWDARQGMPLSEYLFEYKLAHAKFADNEKRIIVMDRSGVCYLWVPEVLLKSTTKKANNDYDLPKRTSCSSYYRFEYWQKAESAGVEIFVRDIDSSIDNAFAVYFSISERLGIDVGQEGVFDAANKHVLTWGSGTKARLYDLTNKQLISEFDHNEKIFKAAFNKDVTRILTRSWMKNVFVQLWDKAGKKIGRPMKHTPFDGANFSPSGKYLVTWGEGKTIAVWNSGDGSIVFPLVEHRGSIEGATFSKDETRLLSWDDKGLVVVTNFSAGRAELQKIQLEGPVHSAVFNADETKVLVVSGNGNTRLWYVGNGFRRSTIYAHKADLIGLKADLPGNQMLTWSGSQDTPLTIRLWDTENAEPISKVMQHDSLMHPNYVIGGEPVGGVRFNKNFKQILSWGGDGTVRLWDASTGQSLVPNMIHNDRVLGALFSPNEEKIVSFAKDKTTRLWDGATGKSLVPSMQHDGEVIGANFSMDGSKILSWGGKSARLWDAKTGRAITPPLVHQDLVYGARFSQDEERVLTWGKDKSARLWNARNGHEQTPPMIHDEPVVGAVFSKDNNKILTWTRFFSGWGRTAGAAQIWDAKSGKPLTEPLLHKEEVNGARFYLNDHFALSWSNDASAKIWDVDTGGLIAVLQHRQEVLGALLSPDEQKILTWSKDRNARLWDVKTGNPLTPPMRHDSGVVGAMFTGDEYWILTWSNDGTVRLWNTADGSPVMEPMMHSNVVQDSYRDKGVSGAKFFRNNTRIAAWGGNAVTVWNVDTDEQFPVNLLPLFLEVTTGTQLDKHGNVVYLSRLEWTQLKSDYKKKIAEYSMKHNLNIDDIYTIH